MSHFRICYYTRSRILAPKRVRVNICVYPAAGSSMGKRLYAVANIVTTPNVAKWIDRSGKLITCYGNPPIEAYKLAYRISKLHEALYPALSALYEQGVDVTSTLLTEVVRRCENGQEAVTNGKC